MPDVRMPDGTVIRNVPAGTPRSQIEAVWRKAKGDQRPTSHVQGFAEGIMPYATNALRVLNKVNPLLNIADTLTGAPRKQVDQIDATTKREFAKSPTRGSTGGRIAGSVVGSLPTMFLPGGVVAQGAAAGALGSEDRSVKGLATNAAAGAAGGWLGNKVVGAAARAISPKVAPVVQRLKDRGIPLTPGQILGAGGSGFGKMVRAIENKATSIPGVGDAIINSQKRGVDAFNRAAFNEALAPIQGKVPGLAEEGVEQARNVVRGAYDNALGPVRIAPDQQFGDELTQAGQLGLTSGGFADDFSRIMTNEMEPVLNAQPGMMTGKNIQDALRISKGYGRQYGKLATTGANGIPQPSAKPAGQAFNDIAKYLESLVNRQAPDVMPAYSSANEAYRNVGVLRDAVNAAKVGGGGTFTPAQLSQASRANAKRFGGTHGTTDQPFFELTRDAQDVLPNTIPNSGSADRGMIGLLLGGVAGLPAAFASGAASIPYSKSGQELVEWLLTGRQGANARATARLIEQLRPLATSGGGVGLAGLLGS